MKKKKLFIVRDSRMIRCGATRVQIPGTSIHPVTDTWSEGRVKVILGWPPDGGVCVYDLLTATPPSPLDESFRGLYEEGFGWTMQLGLLHGILNDSPDMERVCEVLGMAGVCSGGFWGSVRRL